MKYVIRMSLLCGCMLVIPSSANAWLRALQEHAKLVKQAELIVVGRIQPNSIRSLQPAEDGRSGPEYRVTLIITEVLKGTCRKEQIPVLLHHGLEPVAGPKDVVQIFDTGNSAFSFDPEVKDASQNHLWFLRQSGGPHPGGRVARDLGVVEPAEIQPMSLKVYFQAHLSKDPERAIRGLLKERGEIRTLAECYLDLQEVRRIAKLPNSDERTKKLTDYVAKAKRRQSSNVQWALVAYEGEWAIKEPTKEKNDQSSINRD
jgi:hypothetical protein